MRRIEYFSCDKVLDVANNLMNVIDVIAINRCPLRPREKERITTKIHLLLEMEMITRFEFYTALGRLKSLPCILDEMPAGSASC